ncbi:MAG: trigger factor [Holosporaceae bacterium]|jgi:trigger factor|nr:trigger factor [Holosporaceae bacterium]
MEIIKKTADGLAGSYNVLVSADELDAAMTAKLKETAAKTRLDGFRPGKAPLDIVKRMHGSSLQSKAKESAIASAISKVLKDEKLSIYHYETNILKEDANGLEFILKFELIPTFELQDISGIEIGKYVAEIDPKEIESVLESIRKERKNWVEDETAQKVEKGQKIIIDLSRVKPDKNSRDDAIKNLEIMVGGETVVDDFWKHLIGAKISETREFSINYPDGFRNKALAGKSIAYRALVKKILKAQEHKLDDEFAKSLGHENLEKLREWTKSQIASKYDGISRDIMKRDLLDKLSAMYNFDIPQGMLNLETEEVVNQISGEGKRLGKEITPEIKKECVKIAASRVRLGLVVAEIAKREKIRVTKNEISQTINNIAAMYPGRERAIWNMYNQSNAMRTIAAPILEQKVIDFLFGKIKISEKKCSTKELIAIDEEPFDFFKDGVEKVKVGRKPAKKIEDSGGSLKKSHDGEKEE